LISRASEGLTRRINILADKALLAAFSEGLHQVNGRQVRAAIRDAQFQRIAGPARARWLWAGAATALCTTGGLAYLAGSHHASSLPAAAAIRRSSMGYDQAAGQHDLARFFRGSA
jgi:MSHA biogenesis protein MshM